MSHVIDSLADSSVGSCTGEELQSPFVTTHNSTQHFTKQLVLCFIVSILCFEELVGFPEVTPLQTNQARQRQTSNLVLRGRGGNH